MRIPSGIRPGRQRVPPREEPDHERDAAERAGQQERGDRKDEPEERRPAVLSRRRVDPEVDRVRAGTPRESRKAASDEADEREEMRHVADVRGEEAVKRTRNMPKQECGDPSGDRDDDDSDRPEEQPDDVGDREKEAEEDGEPGPLEVVGHDQPDGMLGKLAVRLGELRIGGRIARSEQKEVGTGLRRVPDRERGEVTQPARRASTYEDREPCEEGGHRCDATDRRDVPPHRLLAAARRRRPRALPRRAARESAAESRREEQRRQCEHEAKEASPATLAHRRVDLDVDRVVLLNAEPRIRIGGEEHVRAHLRRVPDVRRDEVVRALRNLALDEDREPVHEAHDERGDASEHHPDDEREREKDPEQHREPAAHEVVAHDESDWTVPSAATGAFSSTSATGRRAVFRSTALTSLLQS